MMRDLIGQQLGNYRLVNLLGRGGFAEVYLGQHVRLSMQAAIKVLHAHLSDEEINGFQREAETIANLIHPHIVRILDFDVSNGIPFLVMDYCAHGTLRKRHTKGERVPLSAVVSYIKQVAKALQYAHDQKLIHRDIKPENILIGRHDDILLSDFGIASTAHSTSSMSMQVPVGTIPYMAPEQIQAHARPASDQYALSIVVYEWLCGERPFEGSYTEIFAKHLMTPPPPLRQKEPTLSPDVEQVVLTALAKDPHQRFATVQAFATALEQACHAKSSVAVPTQPNTAPYQPRPQSAPTVLATPAMPASTAPATPAMPVQTAPKEVNTPHPNLPYIYRGHSLPVEAVIWSPDSKLIASGGRDQTLQVWDATDGCLIYAYREHSDMVRAVAWSPNGKLIVSASSDGTVQVRNAANGHQVYTYRGHSLEVRAVAWSPDGKLIASVSYGILQVWDPIDGSHAYTYQRLSGYVNAVAWSPDGTHIASASQAHTVRVWNLANGGDIYTCRGHSDGVNTVAWSPDGKLIASASQDKTVRVWNATNGGKVYTYRGHSDDVNAVAWFPDGTRIASASKDKTVQVWNAADGGNVFTYQGHLAPVRAVAWSPDGKLISSASEDKTVQVWQAP